MSTAPVQEKGPNALVPVWAARLVGFAALASLGALQWQRMIAGLSSGRALLWVAVAVAEAAAVASPDERRGNVVKAFIVAAAGVEPSDEVAEEIKRFVRDRLGAHAYPRRIEFTDTLPKTLTGKIRRIELREREREAAAS